METWQRDQVLSRTLNCELDTKARNRMRKHKKWAARHPSRLDGGEVLSSD